MAADAIIFIGLVVSFPRFFFAQFCQLFGIGFVTGTEIAPLAAPQMRVETRQTLEQSVDFFTLDSLERFDPPGAARDIAFNLLEGTARGVNDFLLYLFFCSRFTRPRPQRRLVTAGGDKLLGLEVRPLF